MEQPKGGQYGVKETKDAVNLIAGMVFALQQARQDGKFDLSDLQYLVPTAALIQPAVDGSAMIPKELGELDDADKSELKAHIDGKFGEGSYEKLGEDVLMAALHLIVAFNKVSNL